jgi:Flp pilus assembly protein TadB
MSNGATPEQQADYLVRKLEQTIRDNRTVKGMSFRTWQNIAREEITNALRNAEKRRIQHDRTVGRTILVAASALVTIGFWGAVVAVDRAYGGPAALIFLVAGAALFFVAADYGLKRTLDRYGAHRRVERLARIEDLDRRIKRMESDMQKKHDRLKDKMEELQV